MLRITAQAFTLTTEPLAGSAFLVAKPEMVADWRKSPER
jgi:hypothetical protein